MNDCGKTARRRLGIFPIAAATAATALLISGCSELGYPAVHDMPGPRADTPLTPEQVQAATDALISERDRLSTEVQSNGQPNQSANAPSTTGSASAQKASASARPVVAPATAYAPAQGAGADSKP